LQEHRHRPTDPIGQGPSRHRHKLI
jgi:hypothetical protein